jgi:hypothetical protein
MLCTLLGHRPTRKRKLIHRQEHGDTRTVLVGARICTDCGKLLDFDTTIKNQSYAKRKAIRETKKARLIFCL